MVQQQTRTYNGKRRTREYITGIRPLQHDDIDESFTQAHEKFLARQRKAQARRLWKKATCAAWMLVEFRASVERSVAKRAREHFEECAKLQR
jgi:hypothetical protein